MQNKEIADLANLPVIADKYQLAAVQILQQMISPTMTTNFSLFAQVILTLLNLCLQYGNYPQAAVTYSFYGLLVCGTIKDINYGYKFGELAISLLEQLTLPQAESFTIHVYYGFIWHWKKSLNEQIARDKLLNTFQKSINQGEHESSGYVSLDYCLLILFWRR